MTERVEEAKREAAKHYLRDTYREDLLKLEPRMDHEITFIKRLRPLIRLSEYLDNLKKNSPTRTGQVNAIYLPGKQR